MHAQAPRRLALTAIVAASLSPGLASGAAAPDQGIRGQVTIGPTCPVQREGESCERPYAAVLSLRKIGSRMRARTVRTTSSGSFRVRLGAGRYRLTPRGGKPFPTAPAQTVVVHRGRYTTVAVAYDSGIR